MPVPIDLSSTQRRAIEHLFRYLDVRPGVPLMVYEPPYQHIADAAATFAASEGRPFRSLPVDRITAGDLKQSLTEADKFVCAFNRQFGKPVSPTVQVMIDAGLTLCRKAWTLCDVNEVFFPLLQEPPEEIVDRNNRLRERVRRATRMTVTNSAGTHLEVHLSPEYAWVSVDGFEDCHSGVTVNLPTGEIATYPAQVDGTIRLRGALLGTIPIGRKYGRIDDPITVVIASNRVVEIRASNPALQRDLEFCIHNDHHTDQVCEIGLGTHPLIRDVVGLNYSYEEKHWGFHMGFGATLAQQNVERQTGHHLDFLFDDAMITLDGSVLFDGDYRI